MWLRNSLVLAGVVATAAIAGSAALVLTGAEPMARSQSPGVNKAASLAADVAPPLPDPTARGVLVTRSNNTTYFMRPDGERSLVGMGSSSADGVSPDGRWQAGFACDEEGCFLAIFELGDEGSPGRKDVRLPASLWAAEWAPGAARLAALDEDGGLYLVEPTGGETLLVEENVTAYAWTAGDGLVYATEADSTARLWGLDERGQIAELAALSGPVSRFHVSPSGEQVVFAQDDREGWRLLSLDTTRGAISYEARLGGRWLRDYAATGFEPISKTATEPAPELAVAWSPDESMYAAGPVSEPYAMHLIVPGAKWSLRSYSFEEGYAGELAWSPDGRQLAISTYSADRTRHEVYVMDAAGGQAPRHLLDGCKIVWSPDGRFVAVKREPFDATGVAAIRVATGYHWPLTTHPEFIPLSWGEDEEAALAIATQPLPYAVRLGK